MAAATGAEEATWPQASAHDAAEVASHASPRQADRATVRAADPAVGHHGHTKKPHPVMQFLAGGACRRGRAAARRGGAAAAALAGVVWLQECLV